MKKAYQRLVVEIDGTTRSIREDVLKNLTSTNGAIGVLPRTQ